MELKINKRYDEHREFYRLYLHFDLAGFCRDLPNANRLYNALSKYSNLADGLRKMFKKQGTLYSKIDHEKYYTARYQPDRNYFNSDEPGFKKFTKQLTDQELQELTRLYANNLTKKAKKIITLFSNESRGLVNLSQQQPTNNNDKLERLNINRPILFCDGEKCYNLHINKLEQIFSFEDIEQEVYNTISRDVESQIQQVHRNYKNKIMELERNNEQTKRRLTIEVLKSSVDILQRWELVDHHGEICFKYKEPVYVKRINHDGKTVNYDNQNYKKLYVSGLKVRLKEIIHKGDVTITRGFNPHFNGSVCCIGDLSGLPLFKVLKELPRMLETVNMNSVYDGSPTAYIRGTYLKENPMEEELKIWSV